LAHVHVLAHSHASSILLRLTTSLLVDPLHDWMDHGIEGFGLLLELLELGIGAGLKEPESAVTDVLDAFLVFVCELLFELLIV